MDRKTHAVKRLMRFIVRQSIKGHENGALSFELERHLTSTDVIQRRPAVQRRRRLLLPAEQNRTERSCKEKDNRSAPIIRWIGIKKHKNKKRLQTTYRTAEIRRVHSIDTLLRADRIWIISFFLFSHQGFSSLLHSNPLTTTTTLCSVARLHIGRVKDPDFLFCF